MMVITNPINYEHFYHIYDRIQNMLSFCHYEFNHDHSIISFYTSGCRDDPCEQCVYRNRDIFNNCEYSVDILTEDLGIKLKLLETTTAYIYTGKPLDNTVPPNSTTVINRLKNYIDIPEVWDNYVSETSKLVKFLKQYNIRTLLCISHNNEYIDYGAVDENSQSRIRWT